MEQDISVARSDGLVVSRDVINAWCVDKTSQQVTLRIQNCKIEVAIRARVNNAPIPYEQQVELYEKIRRRWPHADWGDKWVGDMKRVKRCPLYGYSEGDTYIVFNSPTVSIAREIGTWLRSGEIGETSKGLRNGRVYEVCGTEFSLVDQLNAKRDLNVTGWNVISERQQVPEVERVSRHNTTTEYTTSYQFINRTDASYLVNPTMVAYDFEVQSGDLKSFPQSFLISDYIGMASVVVWKYGQYEATKKDYLVVKGQIDPIEGVEVICVDTEEEVIDKWRSLIADSGPVMVGHYNGDSFDAFYADDRHERLEMEWTVMGSHKSIKTWARDLRPSMGGRFRRGKSLIIPGVGNADVMKYVVENEKLRSYSLNAVSENALKKQKVDIGDYTTIFKAFDAWDTTKDNTLLKHVSEYGMEDSRLTAELVDHYKLFDNLTAMMQASEVTWDTYVSQGRMKRTEAMMYKMGQKMNPKICLNRRQRPALTTKGGFVPAPIVGRYDYVTTFDFASLYPSCMDAFNTCYATLLPNGVSNEMIRQYYPSIKSDKDIRTIRCEQKDGVFINKFVNQRVKKGLLPSIVRTLLQKRGEAKRASADAYKRGDTMTGFLQFVRQLALKITANSVYGYTDAPGDRSCTEVAQSVTASGRALIIWVAGEIARVFGYARVYGDTDSVMIHIKDATSYKDAYDKSKIVLDYLNRVLQYVEYDSEGRIYLPPESEWNPDEKKPLSMTLEKIARAVFIMKKNYIMVYSDFDDKEKGLKRTEDGKYDLHETGVPSTKRDKALCHVSMYRYICHDLVEMTPISDVVTHIWEMARDIVYDMSDPSIATFSYKSFSYSGRVSKMYEEDSKAAMSHLFHRMTRQGTPLDLGVRFNYYVSDRDGADSEASRVVTENEVEDSRKEMESWVTGKTDREPTTFIRPDRLHNYSKFVATIDKLFEAAHRPELKELQARHHDMRLESALRTTYLKRGRVVIDALSKDANPVIAIKCYADKKTIATFAKAYDGCRRASLITSTPAADAYRYFQLKKQMHCELIHLMSLEI